MVRLNLVAQSYKKITPLIGKAGIFLQ